MKAVLKLICVGLLVTTFFSLYSSSSNSTSAHFNGPLDTDTEGLPCYTITNLGTLGGTSSQAHGVNDNGHVVGWSWGPSNAWQHAFLYKDGTMQDLTPNGTYSHAYGINNSDQIAGVYVPAGLPFRAFRYQNGAIENLGALNSSGTSYAYGINDDGSVAGVSTGTIAPSFRNRAFLYVTTMNDLGVIAPYGTASGAYGLNDNNHVVGYMDFVFPGGVFTSHSFLYSSGSLFDLGSLDGQQARFGEARAINNSSQIAGWSEVTNNLWHRAYLYQNGSMQDLGSLGQQNSEAYGINNDGDVVGRLYSTNFNHAFIYQNGVIQDLNDLLPANSGWELVEARDISDTGHVVGWGNLTNVGSRAFLMSPCGSSNTNPGGNVQVQSAAGDAAVEFSQVTAAGNTTFTVIDPNTAGTPPDGFSICSTCPAYDITTTASYTPPVKVCLDVPASIDTQTFNDLTLLHAENGVVVNVTTERNTRQDGTREVCGVVSSLSPFVLGSPPPAPPAAPSGLMADAVSPTQINLTWADNSGNETGFTIERCSERGKCRNFTEIAGVGPGVTVYSDIGVQGGIAYFYQVRAFNSGGNSGYSNVAKTRTPRR